MYDLLTLVWNKQFCARCCRFEFFGVHYCRSRKTSSNISRTHTPPDVGVTQNHLTVVIILLTSTEDNRPIACCVCVRVCIDDGAMPHATQSPLTQTLACSPILPFFSTQITGQGGGVACLPHHPHICPNLPTGSSFVIMILQVSVCTLACH